nr:RHS repeat-associated core domain-containing protein [Streptomyces sulphureus]
MLALAAGVVPAVAVPQAGPSSSWGEGGEAEIPAVRSGSTKAPASQDQAEPTAVQAAWRTAQKARVEGVGPSARGGETASDDPVAEGQGAVPWHELFDFRVTDALVARVDYSTGNLMLAATDFEVAGVGDSLQLARTYNSLDAPWGKVSQHWWQGFERYLHLAEDEVVLYDATGDAVRFEREGDGFSTPKGYSKDLAQVEDGGFTVTDRKSGVRDHFDEHGTLTEVTDRNHNTVRVEQHDEGDEHKGFKVTEERSGRSVDLVKKDASQWQAKDHTGRTAVFDLDSAGDLVKTTDTESKATEFGYDADRRLTKITTPEGRVTLFTYDSHDRLTSFTRATEFDGDGHTGPTFHLSYTAATPGEAGTTTIADPDGDETAYKHAAAGEVTEVTDPLGHSRARSYDANRNVATATDAMGTGSTPGNVTAYGWDARNNPTSAELPTGATSAMTGYQTIAGTDLPGSMTMPDGEQTDFSYDARGNTTSVAVQGAGGGERKTDYNPADPKCGGFEGQVCSTTDERGKKTTFAYDDEGNLTTATPPDPMGETTYTYDELGRPETVTDGRGVKTVYVYDHRDRITKVSTTNSTVTYAYDADGNMRERHDATGTTKYAFDPLSRETVRTLQDGSQTVLTYHADGNVASYEDPGGTTTYTYDAANRLTELTAPGGKKTTYRHNNNDARTETAYPGGTKQAVTLDESNRPTHIKATSGEGTLVDLTYSYTYGNGTDGTKIRTVKDAVAGTTRSHTYDSAGRFSFAKETKNGKTNNSWQYCYDTAGNLTSQGILEGCPRGTTYDYNDASQITAKNDDPTGWSHDKAGNELAAAPTPETARTSNTWSDFSQLTATTTGGTDYEGEYASTDNSERVRFGDTHFHQGPIGLAATTTDEVDTGFVREAQGTLNSMTRDGESYYYLTDATGNTVAMVDEDGKQTADYYYSPRGVTIAEENQGTSQPYRFAGAYQDPTTMYHMAARYYDTRTGRYTQPDPSGQETNPYLYAAGDPVNNTDPTGLYSWDDFKSDIGAVVGTTTVGAGAGGGIGCAVGWLMGPPGCVAGGTAGGFIGGGVGAVVGTGLAIGARI